MPLRPALKGDSRATSSPFPFASSPTLQDSHHVHFPPTPILTSTALTHSPHVYDRAPIRVSPNTCALPDRGERVYDSEPPPHNSFAPRRKEMMMMNSLQAWAHVDHSSLLFKGSAAAAAATQDHRYHAPSLVPDLSSESEDSDQCVSPQPPAAAPPFVQLAGNDIGGFNSTIGDGPTGPYPYGGGFARQQSYDYDEDLATSTGLFSRLKIQKEHYRYHPHDDGEGEAPVEPNSPKKKNRTRKDRLPAGERTRKLSSTRCITTDFTAEGCLGGF